MCLGWFYIGYKFGKKGRPINMHTDAKNIFIQYVNNFVRNESNAKSQDEVAEHTPNT